MTTIAERTPIVTFQDILNALEQNPELKEQMRQHLRDEDLRNLPQAVARLLEAVAELTVTVRGIAQRQERTEADAAELKAGQARLEAGQARHDADIADLKAGQARLEDGQRRMQSDINRLSGSEYERRIARTLRRNSRRHFGIGNGQLVQSITIPNNNHIPDLLDQACHEGIIQAHEADEAEQTDIVINGEDGANQPAYVAIEASVTIENRDIVKAHERADIISRAAGIPTIAAACGSRIDDETSALAGQYDVTVIILPD